MFRYRNWSIANNLNKEDDYAALEAARSTASFDIATSNLQGCDATSTVDEKAQLALLDGYDEARASIFEQQRHLVIPESIVTDLVPSSSRLAILRYLLDIEPWSCLNRRRATYPTCSPLVTYRISAPTGHERRTLEMCRSETSARDTHDFSICAVYKQDTSSSYHTATSETGTSGVFQSAASYMGDCRMTLPEATLMWVSHHHTVPRSISLT